jgi:hypothetical protein
MSKKINTQVLVLIVLMTGCLQKDIKAPSLPKKQIIRLVEDDILKNYIYPNIKSNVNSRGKQEIDFFNSADWSRVLREQFDSGKTVYSVPIPSVLVKGKLVLRNLIIVNQNKVFYPYTIRMHTDQKTIPNIELTNLNDEILLSTFNNAPSANGRSASIECYEIMITFPTTIEVGGYSSTTYYTESYRACTTSGGSIDGGSITSGDGSVGGSKAPSKNISIVDNKQMLDDLRNEQIKDSVFNFIKDSCLQAMVTKAVYENLDNQISRIINLVFGKSERIDLNFYEVTDFPASTLGEATVGPVTSGDFTRFQADIFLNKNVLPNSSQEMIISTIFHEVFHAYLGYSRDPKKFNDHEEMASNYINLMSSALKGLFPGIPDNHARALAWGGLSETSAWQDLVDNNPIKANEITSINENHANGNSGTNCTK